LVLFENLSFQVQKGTMLAIVGQSGAGKSTLLHILAALDRPSAGAVYCANFHVNSLSEDDAAEFRNREIGYVWQFHYLLPEFTALENVEMPMRIARLPMRDARPRAEELLGRVGLSERLTHRPGMLSGGEQQRAALARALINRPQLLLADEPTGNLDSRTGTEIMNLVRDLNRQLEMTVVMVTHERALAERYAQRLIFLADGKLIGDQANRSAGGEIKLQGERS